MPIATPFSISSSFCYQAAKNDFLELIAQEPEVMKGGTRATFTIAHELGHIVLAHKRTINREHAAAIPIFQNSEWQANAFASEFAMPLPSIQELGLFTSQQISKYFGVSLQAAAIRLEKLLKVKHGKK